MTFRAVGVGGQGVVEAGEDLTQLTDPASGVALAGMGGG
jgi:hypothetical protein